MGKKLPYTIKYDVLPSRSIYNYVGINSIDNYEVPEHRKLKTHQNWKEIYQNREKQDNFYSKLEESILEQGFRNPIIVHAGGGNPNLIQYYPEEVKNTNWISCQIMGGSRLLVAQMNNLSIPCIICDYKNILPNSKILNTRKEIIEKFSYTPNIILDSWGMKISGE